MSELNEQVTVTVDDTPAITVNTPLVEDFTAENAAPKASAVGAALALKADKAGIMEDVVININDETHSDNQGKILLYGDMIPTESGNNKPSVTGAIAAVEGKMYADQIAMASGDTTKISEKFTAVQSGMYGDQIAMSSGDATKISTAIATVNSSVSTLDGQVVKTVASQGLSNDQKLNARTNIGLYSAATQEVYNALDKSVEGYVLDARQGKALNDDVTALKAKFAAQNLTGSVTVDNIDSGSKAAIVNDSLSVIRIGAVCRISLRLQFSAAQNATCLAWKGSLHGIPLPFTGGARGVCATAGTSTVSLFTYYLQTNGSMDIRFVHTGQNANNTAEYICVIEYLIDDNSGGSEGEEE